VGVSVQDLGRRYGDSWVVDGVSFDVPAGEFLSIVGPSGCGKSTTLRMLAGLDRPDRGEVRLDGRVVTDSRQNVFVPAERRRLGFVFQSYALWPHLSVFEHVAYPLHASRLVPERDVMRRVDETLEVVGLSGMRPRYPSELSGGQQQRVALARALVMEPSVLLLDEPLSNLDAGLRARMGHELRALQQRLGFTAVYVTHDRVEALSLSDRVMVMLDGHSVEFGTPVEIYEHPTDVFTAKFVSGANLLAGTVIGVDAKSVRVKVADAGEFEVVRTSRTPELSAGDRVSLAARQETVEVSTADGAGTNRLRGAVQSITYFGAYAEIVVECGAGTVTARVDPPKTIGVTAGNNVDLKFAPATLAVVRGTPGSSISPASREEESR
jgi:ABC-type Fe3+/spermidine/putrescine transport system ATPase subunit